MVDYIRSNQPTMTFSVDTVNEAVVVTVVNPTPTGGRPTVVSNQIWRRTTGSTGNWILAGTVGNNGVLTDLFQRSATSFDYFVLTDTYSESITYTVVTPTVTGLWMYAAADQSTIAHYQYTDGTAETLDEAEAVLQFVGRVYPVVEAGIQETQTLGLTVTVPFSESNWATRVEWWRLRKRERRTLLYRDGRGRVFAGRILGAVSFTPVRQGTQVSCTLQRVDYTASTTELNPTYYVAGIYNDGGNGVYGNGSIGNGY